MRLLILIIALLIAPCSFSQSSFDGTLDFGQSKRLNYELTVQKLELGVHIILPESWTRGLVKKSLNLTKRYDQTNPTQIHA